MMVVMSNYQQITEEDISLINTRASDVENSFPKSVLFRLFFYID